ncbi:MAG: hypothetical protein NTW14_04000 [bacterium]|nr:hypothetical protein [bacterium]
MDRSVVFVHIPAFMIAVERVLQPRLAGRPLVVASPDSARALVQVVSDEARHSGIRTGMRLNEAARLCRDLGVLNPNPPLYARAEAAILRILNRYTPFVEPNRSGSAYLDVTSTIKLFGGAGNVAFRAEREIRDELRLIPSAGLAVNKLVSGVAGRRSPPSELIEVEAGSEQSFLSPLQAHALPAVDRPCWIKLCELNVRIVQQLAEISTTYLELALGRKGALLHRQALGEDYSPVQPPSAVPHLSHRIELPEDSNDIVTLKKQLFGLVETSMSELRQRGRGARRLQLDLLYSDLKAARGTRTLRSHSNLLSGWYTEAEALFLQILTRRIRVRAIEVRFWDFAPDPAAQTQLFAATEETKEISLSTTLDGLRQRFGMDAVKYARAG